MPPRTDGHAPRGRAALLVVAALLLLSLAGAQSADAFIYWIDDKGTADDNAIGRADLDGAWVDKSFITGTGSAGIAVDDAHVYWSNGYAIARADLDGANVEPGFIRLGGEGGAFDIAVEANRIYWTRDGAIGRANVDGSAVEPALIEGIAPSDVAVGDGHVYWADAGPADADPRMYTIGRANLDGSGVDRSFIVVPSDGGDVAIPSVAVESDKVYWTQSVFEPPPGVFCTLTIGRANTDGASVDPEFLADPNSVGYGCWDHWWGDLAADATHLYWKISGGENSLNFSTGILRADLDGTGVETVVHGEEGPLAMWVQSIAVDDLTDTAIFGDASAPPKQRQRGKRVVVRLEVTAGERLTAAATGDIKSKYQLTPVEIEVATDEVGRLKLKLEEAQAKKVVRILKRRKQATAHLAVTLTDRATHTKTQTLQVRLRRR